MIEEDLQITVNGCDLAAVRVWDDDQEPGWVLVYAPGAGSNLHDPFGRWLAQHLAGAAISPVGKCPGSPVLPLPIGSGGRKVASAI